MALGLSTHIWAGALVRRANMSGAFAMIARKGDEARGDVVIKVVDGERRVQLFGQAFNPEGEIEFERINQPDDEPSCETYLQKRIGYDGDLWIIEIEDREGRHFLEEKVRNSHQEKPGF